MASLFNSIGVQPHAAEIRFGCTKCGRCCHGYGLPLTWDEAVGWLADGGRVDVYCEADLWPSEPPPNDLRAAHRKRRSFAASCGEADVRITTIFVAAMDGACRNLRDDLTCGIYASRPLVCRVYPAEINPFIQLDPARKVCPPEAWQQGEVLIQSCGTAKPNVQMLIEESRQTDQNDATYKDLLCRFLRIDVAAIHGEGFIKYSPNPKLLLQTLRNVRAVNRKVLGQSAWHLCSSKAETRRQLSSAGAHVAVQTSTAQYTLLAA